MKVKWKFFKSFQNDGNIQVLLLYGSIEFFVFKIYQKFYKFGFSYEVKKLELENYDFFFVNNEK